MRLIYVYPGPLSATDGGGGELQRRAAILRGWAAPDVEIDVVDTTEPGRAPEGPVSFETAYEGHLLVRPTARALVAAEADGYNGAILGCFGDPGLDGLRERLCRLPLIGPGASACHVAAMLGDRFGIITTSPLFVNPARRMVAALGFRDRLAGVELVGKEPRALAHDTGDTLARIVGAADWLRRAGADTLVLGCMTMGFLDLGEELQERTGLPVVNPVRTALHAAELMVRSRLRPSKDAFPTPKGMIY